LLSTTVSAMAVVKFQPCRLITWHARIHLELTVWVITIVCTSRLLSLIIQYWSHWSEADCPFISNIRLYYAYTSQLPLFMLLCSLGRLPCGIDAIIQKYSVCLLQSVYNFAWTKDTLLFQNAGFAHGTTVSFVSC
jgi:hypothetical protein